MEKVKYSFIMAAYNAEKYIDFAIQSVIRQSYSNWELVVINDGSMDNTENIVKKYEESDSRIKLVTTEHLGTASRARNRALDYLTGNYTQMLDSDDYISDDFLERCNDKLEKLEYDILVPDAVCITDERKIVWEKKPVYNDYDQILDGETAFMLSLDWKIHGIFLVKSDILKKIRYDPEFINGDEFTTRKLLYNSHQISFFKGTYFYRKNIESTTLNPENRVRMLECINTDTKLYHFCIENQMNSKCIRAVEKRMIKSIVSYQLKFERIRRELNIEDDKKIVGYMRSAYSLINVKMLCENICLHSFFLFFSLGSYKLFDREIHLLDKMY